MESRDSFDPPPARAPGRVKRLDIHLQVLEIDHAEVPAVEEELDGEGAVITEAVDAVPAYSEVVLKDSYEYHRPDEAGGSADYCKGAWRPHLTATEKGHIKNALERSFGTINGDA